ncbi:P-loop containing nucleoside triphosphate hydrolase protein [Mycena filopes]|nr:P-loop containing nucleoside triphosphate hydrolase protein [Mycena filopes]
MPSRLIPSPFHRSFRASPRLKNVKFVSTTPGDPTLVLSIPKANVYRFGDANRAAPVFRDLEWSINSDQSWAVVGSGSGEKSAIFDMLMGHLRIHPSPPLGLFPFLTASQADPHKCISMVSFANRRAAGGAFYDYTARYGAVREEDRITLRQSMFPETIQDLKSQSRVALDSTATDTRLFEDLVAKMGLADLLDLPRIALSNGQTRRARILQALLAKPRLLLLDEPLTGLDVENRATVLSILHELHTACNPHIIIGLRTQDAVPSWVTHLARVDDGQVRAGPKGEIMQQCTVAGVHAAPAVQKKEIPLGEVLVEMKNVSVTYGPRCVLQNINWTIRKGGRYHLQGANGSGKTTLISILTGDHPQSYTQLNPPRNESESASPPRHLRLFGLPRARLPTPVLQARIGLLTPELFDAFPRRHPGLSVWDVLGTGFEGGFVPLGKYGVGVGVDASAAERGEGGEGLSDKERVWRVRRCWEVLGALGVDVWGASAAAPATTLLKSPSPALRALADLPFASLPTAQQRLLLLLRALVGRPPLLLLDEPFSGMDGRMVERAKKYLRDEFEEGLRTEAELERDGGGKEGLSRRKCIQAVVCVGHEAGEVPWPAGEEGVTGVVLKQGKLLHSTLEGGGEAVET